MIVREYPIRVRYKETDNMGVVHHSNYVNYFEVARAELMRELGVTYKEMEERGMMLPVKEVKMDFIAPAYYDDLLTVRIALDRDPGVKLHFLHEIYNEAGTLLHRGEITLVFVDALTRRPRRAPKWFVDLIRSAESTESTVPAGAEVL